MKIFNMIGELHTAFDTYEDDYSKEYRNGYRDCLSDMEERLKDSIEVKTE